VIGVRRARLADLDALLDLEHAAFGTGAWSRQAIAAEFLELGSTREIVVADHDVDVSVVHGYAVGRYVADTADVNRLVVGASRRRRGVGSQLLTALVVEAQQRGCERMLLEVAAANISAIGLYAAHGFETIDRRPRYYNGVGDAVVMQRRLGHD